MAIVWGGWNGHLRVGIDVWTDGYDTNTPSINVYVAVHVQCDSTWNFSDQQSLVLSGNIGGTWNFFNGLQQNQSVHVGTYTIGGQGQNYNGGPTYWFHAQLTGAYNGAAPNCGINWTLPARPANVPTAPGIWVDQVGASSARINIGGADGRGAGIEEYQVHVSLPGGGWPPYTAEWSGGTRTVTGLQPATSYNSEVRARNRVGWGPYAYSGMFTTGAVPPGVPGGFTVSDVTQTGAKLAWTAPGSGGSAITGYTVQLATDSGFTSNLKSMDTQALNLTLSGLIPGTRYWTRVRANNAAGSGTFTVSKELVALAGTPTILSPASGGTYGNGIIDVTLSALGIAPDRTITLEVSKSSTFASDVRTVTLDPPGVSSNNQYRLVNANQYLSNGTWYARAKVTNNTSGYVTPWSTVVSFVQAHAPSASAVSPTAGSISQYGPTTQFTWRIVDSAAPNDWQTAYRLVVENNSTGDVVYDSGKTALVTNPNNTTVNVSVALPASIKAVALRWRVQVWDRADTASAWTGYGLFTLADAPVITIVEPAPSLPVDNGAPTFAWNVSIPSRGTQARALVSVYDAVTNETVWQGSVTGQGQSVTPNVVILRNANSYYFTIQVVDTTNLSSTVTGSFTTSYEAPDAFAYTVAATQADTQGYVLVNWEDANPDDLFAAWKVYRRTATTQWTPIATITNQNVRAYRDYMLSAGESYSYSVTQVATRSGQLLESPVGYYTIGEQSVQETRYHSPNLSYYWIINPDNPDQSVRLVNVTADSNNLEREKASYTIIGRGRHVDYGDELGYAGTITCEVRTPERPSKFRQAMEALWRAKETYYLRTPFGQMFPIALGDLGWAPEAGVGTAEMGNMTIPYEEVH